MRRIILVSIALFSLTITSHTRTLDTISRDSLVTLNIKCIDDSLSIKIPSGQFKIQSTSYAEGSIFSIIYLDGSIISILCGYSADLQSKKEKDDNSFSRKTKIRGRPIVYENVKADRLDIFDKAFDSMDEN